MDNKRKHFNSESSQKSLFDLNQLFDSSKDNFDQIIADRTSILLDLPSTYKFNTERLAKETSGSVDPETDFEDLPSRYQLTVNGDEGDKFSLRARQRNSYVPNYELLWGIAYYMENELAEGQKLTIEHLDTPRENGYVLELTSNGKRAYILNDGEEVGARNLGHDDTFNPFDNGLSETTPQICRTFVSWYGAGPGRFTINSVGEKGVANNDVVARIANRDSVATGEINLRMGVTLECTEPTTANTVNVLSMGALIRGDGSVTNRVKESARFDLGNENINDEPTPILAIRRRDSFAGIPTALTSMAASPSDDMRLFGVAFQEENVDVDEASWDVPPQQDGDNTAVETSTAITDFELDADGNPDGRLLSSMLAYPGQGNRRSRTEIDILDRFYDEEIVVIFAETRSASGASTDLEYGIRQEW